MKKTLLITGVLALVASTTVAHAEAPRSPRPPAANEQPEGCYAYNPGQPSCKFTVTEDLSNFGGVTGSGEWRLVIKRGKKKLKMSGDGLSEGQTFTFLKGDKVTLKVVSTPSAAIAGGF